MSKSEKKEQAINKEILKIADRYLIDLECLREMQSSVIPILNESDQDRAAYIKKYFRDAEDKKEDVEQQSTKDSEDKKEDVEQQSTKDSDRSEAKNKSTVLKFQSREEVRNFLSNTKKFRRARKLFERQMIVTLVSRFDEFLAALLTPVLRLNPEWLSSSEKTITFRELVELESIESAVDGIVHKEIENLLRGSHEDQISYVDGKFKAGLVQSFKQLPDFLEVAERRNLFVHTGGVVSQQYLDKCDSFNIKAGDICIGDTLTSDPEYFENAFLVYFEAGLRISQAAYRRLFPKDLDIADQSLNSLAYDFMCAEEFHLSELISKFVVEIPEKLRGDSESIFIAKINLSASKKFLGKEFESVLSIDPWSAFQSKYRLCIHALREEYVEAAELMALDEIQDENCVGRNNLEQWPALKEFRETPEFREKYIELYSEEYVPTPSEGMEALSENNSTETH